MRRYVIGGLAYAVLMVVAIVALKTCRSGPSGPVKSPWMTDKEIKDALEEPFQRLPNSVKASEMLEKAHGLFADRDLKPGNLYKCVKYFKLCLAYQGTPYFTDYKDDQMFRQALAELVDKITKHYQRARAAYQAGQYQGAERAYRDVFAMLPVKEVPEPEAEHPIFQNVIGNLVLVRKKLERD